SDDDRRDHAITPEATTVELVRPRVLARVHRPRPVPAEDVGPPGWCLNRPGQAVAVLPHGTACRVPPSAARSRERTGISTVCPGFPPVPLGPRRPGGSVGGQTASVTVRPSPAAAPTLSSPPKGGAA